MDDWDDTPPPLSSLADQLHAAQLASSIIGTAGIKEGELRVAATTHDQKPAPAAGTKPFKRGFLDAKPQKQQGKQAAAIGSTSSRSQQSVTTLKPKQAENGDSNQIPSMFKLEPTEEQKRYNVLKSQLVDALAPTPETIAAVGSNQTLASGFEDPEVMAAVAEVARDPSAIKKYANNRKVQQFYMAFGSLMGHKLESVSKQANQQSSSRPPSNFLP